MPILDLENVEEVKRYEEFIKTSDFGHSMQSVNWAYVKDNWDRDYVYLEDNEGNIKAAMSILSIKNDGEHAFLYAPRGPVCNINDIETVNKLIEEARSIVKKHKGFLLRLDPEVRYSDQLYESLRENINAENYSIRSRNLQNEKAFSNPRNLMIFDINGRDIEQIMSDFTSKKRSAIKKTYRDGVQTRRIKFGDPNFQLGLDCFYELTEIMAERQGITYRPKDYFVRLFEAYDDAILYETFDEEEVLASGIVTFYNNKAFYLYSASSDNKRNKNAAKQMNIEAIKDTSERKMKEYDFGGVYSTDTSDGLYNFKHWFTGAEGLRELIGEIDIIYNQELYDNFIN